MQSSFANGNKLYMLLEEFSRETAIQECRFPARNFMLESAVPPSRVEDYLRYTATLGAGGGAAAAYKSHIACHKKYVEEELCRGVRFHEFSPSASDCPVTFRSGLALEELRDVDDSAWLVRVEDFSLIKRKLVGEPGVEKLWPLLTEVGEGVRARRLDDARRDRCDHFLGRWQGAIDNRPIFSAVWDDPVKDVLRMPQPGWAEEVRDRLGLAHYTPDGRSPEVRLVAFHYPVTLVPRSSNGRRILLRPTVLDGTINEAFYTSPPEAGAGASMDLKARDDAPWREVVHPAFEFRAEHVWATGIISSGPDGKLSGARGHHALKLCLSASDDFVKHCNDIDGDLI